MHTTDQSVVRNEDAMSSPLAWYPQAKQTCLPSSKQGNLFQYKFVPHNTLTTKNSFFAWDHNIDTISSTTCI